MKKLQKRKMKATMKIDVSSLSNDCEIIKSEIDKNDLNY